MATKQKENTLFGHEPGKRSSIEEDFMYGVTVAQTSVQIRLAFLRKVYGILSAQLLMTITTAALFIYTPPVKEFVQQSPALLLVAMFMSLGLIIALMFKRREAPTNMYLLFAFTLVEAYTIGTVVTFYDQAIVLEAFVLTAATTVALTMYTLQSNRDFSGWGAGLLSMLWILILAGFLQFFFHSDTFELAYAVLGALVFAMFIIYDTHMLMHKLSPEEYILACINLYLDIINLFIEILRILEKTRSK